MAEPLKYRYNEKFFDQIIKRFKAVYPAFNTKIFLKLIFDKDWEQKELKERMRHITICLHQTLKLPYSKAILLLKKAIVGDGGFEYMFFPDFVEVYGQDHLKISLQALAHFTEYASAEFAVRPFIIKYEEETMQQMLNWSQHNNQHVRRLASEGCRPRLPWAMALPKFKKDPTPVLPILENLKDDISEYVRRSVANNLNDIAKDHPDIVFGIAKKWIGKTQETNRLVKHACRTLLKQGNPDTLMLFGFGNPAPITINKLSLQKRVIKIGDDLHFNFELEQPQSKEEKLRLEYAIDYIKKTGKSSRKIFQLSERTFPQGSTNIKRKQSFKDFSTRKHYEGRHTLTIFVNGVEKGSKDFEVKTNK